MATDGRNTDNSDSSALGISIQIMLQSVVLGTEIESVCRDIIEFNFSTSVKSIETSLLGIHRKRFNTSFH